MNAETFIAKARSILSDNAGRRTVGRQSSGPRLDRGRVALLGAGDYLVFRKPHDRAFKSWHVVILVDCSGSIHRDGKTSAYAECIVRLRSALRLAGVGLVETRGFNRFEFPDLEKYADDQEKLERLFIACRCGGMENYGIREGATGGSHIGYFTKEEAKRMAQMPFPGKIVLVVTDGDATCDHADCGAEGCFPTVRNGMDRRGRMGLENDCMVSAKEAKKIGVQVLGIGINASRIRGFYGERFSENVTKREELFQKAAILLEKNIIRG